MKHLPTCACLLAALLMRIRRERTATAVLAALVGERHRGAHGFHHGRLRCSLTRNGRNSDTEYQQSQVLSVVFSILAQANFICYTRRHRRIRSARRNEGGQVRTRLPGWRESRCS